MHTPLHQSITEAHPIAAMLVRKLVEHGCFDPMGDRDEDIWVNSPVAGTAFWVVSPGARMAKDTLEGSRTRGWQLFLSQTAVSTWKEEPKISVPDNSAETEAKVSEWVRARLAEQAVMGAQ